MAIKGLNLPLNVPALNINGSFWVAKRVLFYDLITNEMAVLVELYTDEATFDSGAGPIYAINLAMSASDVGQALSDALNSQIYTKFQSVPAYAQAASVQVPVLSPPVKA